MVSRQAALSRRHRGHKDWAGRRFLETETDWTHAPLLASPADPRGLQMWEGQEGQEGQRIQPLTFPWGEGHPEEIPLKGRAARPALCCTGPGPSEAAEKQRAHLPASRRPAPLRRQRQCKRGELQSSTPPGHRHEHPQQHRKKPTARTAYAGNCTPQPGGTYPRHGRRLNTSAGQRTSTRSHQHTQTGHSTEPSAHRDKVSQQNKDRGASLP